MSRLSKTYMLVWPKDVKTQQNLYVSLAERRQDSAKLMLVWPKDVKTQQNLYVSLAERRQDSAKRTQRLLVLSWSLIHPLKQTAQSVCNRKETAALGLPL